MIIIASGYVREQVHTAGIDSHWAMLKGGSSAPSTKYQ